MDAQALLTPDAVDHEMGKPLATSPTRPRRPRLVCPPPRPDVHRHVRRTRHPTDRYYWMSDIYRDGDMDAFIRIALDRAAVVREITGAVANVQHPDVAPAQRRLRELRQDRDDDRHRLGRRAGVYECRRTS